MRSLDPLPSSSAPCQIAVQLVGRRLRTDRCTLEEGNVRIRIMVAAVVCALLTVLGWAPNVQADTVTVNAPQPLRFVTYNLCGSVCPLNNIGSDDTARVNDVVSQTSSTGWHADAIFLEEVCQRQYDQLNADLTPLGYTGRYAKTMNTGSGTVDSKICRGTAYGVAVFVRGQVLDQTDLDLTQGGEVEPIVSPCMEFLLQGRAVWGCDVHLYWKYGTSTDISLVEGEAAALAGYAQNWENKGIPVILGGDFNHNALAAPLSDFYSPTVHEGGSGRFMEADETDTDHFGSVCDPATHWLCRTGATTWTDVVNGTSATDKLDYVFFSQKYFKNAVGDALPRDADASDHQLYRAAASWAPMGSMAAVGDMTGDGVPDMVAVERATGDLYLYKGPDFSGGGRTRIGTSSDWNDYDSLTAIQVGGSGGPQLLATAPDGTLYRLSGTDFGTKTQIGTHWNTMTNITAVGDASSPADGYTDIVAVDPALTGAANPDLFRYSGPNYSGSTRQAIGTSWDGYDTLTGIGDLTGDGNPDLLATAPDGSLYRYSGPGFYGSSRVQIGTRWNTMTDLVSPGDLTGDGIPDLLATDRATGYRYLYAGPGFSGTTRVQIGTNW